MTIYGHRIVDWSRLKEVPAAEHKQKIFEAINHVIAKIAKGPVVGSKAQAADPNLQSPRQVVLITSDTIKTPDRGYEVLFDEVDMRASSNPAFEVMDITGGVTFTQHKPGEKAKLSTLPTAAKAVISAMRLSGGFPILDDWLRFNQYYKIDQLTRDTVARWFDQKANIFYAMLSATTGTQAFATDDVTTINNACANIITDLVALGYVVDENARFVLTCHPLVKARIYKALNSLFTNPNTNSNQLVFNLDTVVTTAKVASDGYWVSLPGVKNQRGEWEDLNMRPAQRDELMLGSDYVWTGSYNGVIGENKQHRKCALS